ncbi:MAG: hypothetical protein ACR2II_13640 [Chthoniobacterales bacterium]
MIAVHTKAVEARLATEKFCREEMERRGLLVLKSEITDRCRRLMDKVLRRLNKLPGEGGPQCNPTEALMAVTVLQRMVDEIKVAAQTQ